MPILIKDYNWQETEEYITIRVPLKGVHKKHVGFLTCKQYIKASYPPYFFEIFLSRSVDHLQSECVITDDEIIFNLYKANDEKGLWKELEAKIDKKDKLELKKKYLEAIQEENQALHKQKVEKNAELKRFSVREQIALDTKKRNIIDNIKKEETEKALTELQLWETKEKIEHKISIEPKKYEVAHKNKLPEHKNVNPKPSPPIPLPRKCQSVNVSFTAREFSTPSRESKAKEEQEWLTKQAEARRSVGFNDEDLRPEERNPQWLKDKGDEFFKAKNYLGAISAYSSGIKLSKNLVSLYVNRSAAHFSLGNFHKTIEDCTTALDKMVPICEANRISRAKCIARRGAALCKLGLLKQGKEELEAAQKLAPNEKLQEDINQIDIL